MPEGKGYAVGSPFMDAIINDAARIAMQKANGNMQRAIEIFYLMMDKIATDATMSAINQTTQERRKGMTRDLRGMKADENIKARKERMKNLEQINGWRNDLIKRSAGLNALGAVTATAVKIYAGFKNKDKQEKIAAGIRADEVAGTDARLNQAEVALEISKVGYENAMKEGKGFLGDIARESDMASSGDFQPEEITPRNQVDSYAPPEPEGTSGVIRPETASPLTSEAPPAGRIPVDGQPSKRAVQGTGFDTQEKIQAVALKKDELAAEKGLASIAPSTLADVFNDGEISELVANIMFSNPDYTAEELDSPWDANWAEGVA